MNQFRHSNILIFIILIYSVFNVLYAEDNPIAETWKFDLQILLGFSDDAVDGIMGIETFNALKKFANYNDLSDVVLRGEFGDIERWGFEQYLIKYHAYWLRELKNKRIFQDLHDKEYLRQADETLYTFEIAIQNAKLEVERLTQAKLKEERLAKEQKKTQEWQIEKNEVERLTSELQKSIIEAELESEKWDLERKRAQRLAEEKELLTRLKERKLEAAILALDFEDVISVARREIDRLIEENNKIKSFINTSKDTKLLADELKMELKVTRMQLDSLSIQKDSLENKLLEIELLATKEPHVVTQEKKWYSSMWPSGVQKKELEKSPSSDNNKEEEELPPPKKKKKWYRRLWPFGENKKESEKPPPSDQKN